MIDVCLLLEGTYPYVAGGVSTWVHQMIQGMKDVRFGIVHIAAHRDPTRELKYKMPGHVVYLQDVYLHDYVMAPTRNLRRVRPDDVNILNSFYRDVIYGRVFKRFPDFARLFQKPEGCFDIHRFFDSPDVWQLITDFYLQITEPVPFIDFFWNWRGTQLPLVQVLSTKLPRAKIYHAVSTGYAGLLGAMAKVQTAGKFFLTEHGIYTYERTLEIAQANWIYESTQSSYLPARNLSFFKQWWIDMFRAMSQLAYDSADKIFTLYQGNKNKQIAEGAQPERVDVIPNGLKISPYLAIQRKPRPGRHVGLIGRVVSIKDIKTFIQAAQQVVYECPDVRFYVLGPTEEERDYYAECQQLVEARGLEENFVFTGRVELSEYLSFLDLVVLTSLSEAQPYVILEANLCGIPVVSTNVGACSEMLNGSTEEDRNLGPSGLLTQVSNAAETAAAITRLLSDRALYRAMQNSGRERVQRYYNEDDMISRYLNQYEQNL